MDALWNPLSEKHLIAASRMRWRVSPLLAETGFCDKSWGISDMDLGYPGEFGGVGGAGLMLRGDRERMFIRKRTFAIYAHVAVRSSPDAKLF
jgi:hypothetical protein